LYSSLLPQVAQRATKLIVEIEPRLVPLYERSFPNMKVIPHGAAPYDGPIERQLPIGSLPRVMVGGWDDFPGRRDGFLKPDPDRVMRLRERVCANGKPAIGLSWISRRADLGQFKSARLRDFKDLMQRRDFNFVDLQYGDTSEERAALEREFGIRILHLNDVDNQNDLDGLAALISACDAVVTVSSTTAHLAGAVGAPTWVMVPSRRVRLWYWFADKPESPWYPRVQVRRQGRYQGWSELIQSLIPEVTRYVAERSAPDSRPSLATSVF
jgi:hypothetical protein